MKIKSMKIPLISIFCLLGYLLYTNIYQDDVLETKISYRDKNVEPINNDKVEVRQNDTVKKAKLSISENAQTILDNLNPISKEILKDDWKLEFGCYSTNTNNDSNMDSCDNMYLTASSYEEAVWMQRQGYPSSSNLKLLEDSENIEYIEELAGKKYTAAMALLAIQSLNNNEYRNASSMALKLRAYSPNTNTFPHRIRGEALLADNKVLFGLSALKTASLLGDYEATYLFNRYIHKYPSLVTNAIDQANLYMGRVFGVPFGQYPIDERPKYSDNGS